MPERVISFDEYERRAAETAVYPEAGEGTVLALWYTAIGLGGEAGEVLNKIKKVARDDDGVVTNEKRMAIAKELGDVFWYIAAMCREIGVTMEEVATLNVLNLSGRHERGTLTGDGDNR